MLKTGEHNRLLLLCLFRRRVAGKSTTFGMNGTYKEGAFGPITSVAALRQNHACVDTLSIPWLKKNRSAIAASVTSAPVVSRNVPLPPANTS